MVAQLTAGGSLRVPMSWEQWSGLGETRHAEYYDGLVVVNPPTRRHQVVERRLATALAAAAPGGVEVVPESGWAPSEHTVFEPDIVVVADDAPDPDVLRVPPLLVVEILSPSTRAEDLGRKAGAYAAGGARHYWVVDPDADTLTVRRLVGSRYEAGPALGAGARVRLDEPFPVTLDLAALFAR